MLELKAINKSFQTPDGSKTISVLRDVSLQISAGDTVSIVGASGSGKTTLLHLIGTLDRATSGSVIFEGKDLASLGDEELARVRNRDLGFIFQEHHLLPQCTVLENVLVPVLAFGKVDEAAAQQAHQLLDRVGLADRADHRPGQLSGGECQRVAFVRSLINRPKLLLADEPTGALDRQTAEQLIELLAELNREAGTALIAVTHAPYLAERMQRCFELKDGTLSEWSA